jgi:hypothetical protein
MVDAAMQRAERRPMMAPESAVAISRIGQVA